MRMIAMKPYLTPILIILVLASGLLVGCDQGANPKPFPSPESAGEEILENTPENQELLAPKVFEKHIEAVSPASYWLVREGKVEVIDLREPQTLRFPVAIGNRMEGEVTFSRDSILSVFSQVRDPYKNIVAQSARSQRSDGTTYSAQKYPWRFAFIAAATGEYSLQVDSGNSQLMGEPLAVHLKVTVYEK